MTEERSCRAHKIFLRFAPIVSGVFSDGIEDVLLCAAHRTTIILKCRKQRLYEFLVLIFRDVWHPERVVIIAVPEDDTFNFRVLAHSVFSFRSEYSFSIHARSHYSNSDNTGHEQKHTDEHYAE